MPAAELHEFPIEVQAKIKQALMEGGRKNAEAVIAEFQAENKAALKAQGIDVDSFVPVIGQHIGWGQIERQVFRVLEFDRANATIGPDGYPKKIVWALPCGALRVESPILNQPARIPIIHRVDFLLACRVFDGPHLPSSAELLVSYAPKGKTLGFLPSLAHFLHFVVCRRGTLESYYDDKDRDHVRYPNLDKLFGKLRYSYASLDQIKVTVHPQF